MMIKTAGSVLILLTAVFLGFLKGQQYEDRIHDMKILEYIFQELLSDIEYGKITMGESFGRIEKKVQDPFCRFLKNLCGEVKWKRGRRFEDIFAGELDACLRKSALSPNDLQKLKALGYHMGVTEKESQIHAIQTYLRELKTERENLECIAPDKKKICRVLGISGGAFLVIILL